MNFSSWSFGIGIFVATSVCASERTLSLQDILSAAESTAPAILLERLEAKATRASGWAGAQGAFPELGLEGGMRSEREKQIRNDEFYYAYARYEIGLKEISEMKTALAQRDFGEISERVAQARAIRALIGDFLRALSLQRQIELKEADLAVAEKQILAAQKRISAGLAAESDILEFRMHQNALQNDLRLLRLDVESSLQDLQRLLGFTGKISGLTYEMKNSSDLPSEEEAWTSALSSNLELAQYRLRARQAEGESQAALGAFLPRVSAEGLYGKLQDSDFGESRKNSWSVVGKLTVPIFNGGASAHRLSQKRAEADRAQMAALLEENRLKDRLRSAISKSRALSEKLSAEEKNLKDTQKYFDLVTSEYRRGVKGSPDLASATDKLFDAHWRVFETWRDLVLSKVDLAWLQGKDISL